MTGGGVRRTPLRDLGRAGEKLHRIKTYLKAATALAATVGKVVRPL